MTARRAPDRKVERLLWDEGHDVVVGIDEVGRGAWAGPLAIGVAVLPRDRRVNGVRDSKMLTENGREALFDRVAGWCTAWAVGWASERECDQLGMAEAQRLATRRAIADLGVVPDAAITDGTWDFVSPVVPRVEMRVKADATCLPVSAASILAKVSRDRWMRAAAEHYPQWRFDGNKGYPCPVHKAALAGYGPSVIHRRTWAFMDHFVPWSGVQRRAPGGQTRLFESTSGA